MWRVGAGSQQALSAACAARQSEASVPAGSARAELQEKLGVAECVEAEGVRYNRAPARNCGRAVAVRARPPQAFARHPACASAVAPAHAVLICSFAPVPMPRQAAQEAARARAPGALNAARAAAAAAAAAALLNLLRPCCATQHSHAAMSFSMLNFSMACAAQSMESCCMSSLMSCGRAKGCGERWPAGGAARQRKAGGAAGAPVADRARDSALQRGGRAGRRAGGRADGG